MREIGGACGGGGRGGGGAEEIGPPWDRPPSCCISGGWGCQDGALCCWSRGLGPCGGWEGGAGMSPPGYRASHTPGRADPGTPDNSRKTPDLEPVDPAQKQLPGVLPSPFRQAPGLPSPRFGGYLFPPSQSHTILVGPDADRAQLECGVCARVRVRVCAREASRAGRPTGPSSLSSQGPLDRAGPRRSGLGRASARPLLPSLAEEARGPTILFQP